MVPQADLKRIKRTLRSIAYRQRLLEKLPELEAEVIALVQEQGLRRLDGYEVEVVNGRLKLRRLPKRDLRQMKLRFEGQERRGSGGHLKDH